MAVSSKIIGHWFVFKTITNHIGTHLDFPYRVFKGPKGCQRWGRYGEIDRPQAENDGAWGRNQTCPTSVWR